MDSIFQKLFGFFKNYLGFLKIIFFKKLFFQIFFLGALSPAMSFFLVSIKKVTIQ